MANEINFTYEEQQELIKQQIQDGKEASLWMNLDEGLLNSETLSELAGALKALPEELRAVIVLRYYDGKPLTEVAEIMGLSYGAVKLRHQSALAKLHKALA